MSIKERIFLVGCPRSGTTLLQSFLAAHSQIASFPESKFFQRLTYPGTIRSRFGIASERAKPNFYQFLEEINHQEMKLLLPEYALFISQYAKAFIEALDTITVKESKNCWLEKTPAHVQRIKYIEKFVPQSKFIHIIRDGRDVVASLHEVTHKFPDTWNGAWDIDKCIRRWQNDVKISTLHLHKSNHLLVKYDLLIENPEKVLNEVCGFINVPFEKKILKERALAAKKLIRTREKWKDSVNELLQTNKLKKFDKLFNGQEKKYIIEQLQKAKKFN